MLIKYLWLGYPRSSPETRIWVEVEKRSQKVLGGQEWARTGENPRVCHQVALHVGNWGSVPLGTWETVISSKGKEAGVSIHHLLIFLWLRTTSRSAKPPAPQACPVCRLSTCNTNSLQFVKLTAEDDGRAPKSLLQRASINGAQPHQDSECTSELEITGFEDNASQRWSL